MKLRQQIPKHIYDRGASELGEPDFYVGPTIEEKQFPNGSRQAIRQDDDLKAEMDEMREEAEKEIEDRPSLLSLILGRIFRGRARDPHTAG